MLHCFGNTIAEQQLQHTGSGQVMSHQLEGLSPDGASEPTTPQGMKSCLSFESCDEHGGRALASVSQTAPPFAEMAAGSEYVNLQPQSTW
jgi:hypothetical protein